MLPPLFTVNEIKRQGELLTESSSKVRAWVYNGDIYAIDEQDNSLMAVVKNNECYIIPDKAKDLILAAAGVK